MIPFEQWIQLADKLARGGQGTRDEHFICAAGFQMIAGMATEMRKQETTDDYWRDVNAGRDDNGHTGENPEG